MRKKIVRLIVWVVGSAVLLYGIFALVVSWEMLTHGARFGKVKATVISSPEVSDVRLEGTPLDFRIALGGEGKIWGPGWMSTNSTTLSWMEGTDRYEVVFSHTPQPFLGPPVVLNIFPPGIRDADPPIAKQPRIVTGEIQHVAEIRKNGEQIPIPENLLYNLAQLHDNQNENGSQDSGTTEE